MLFTLFTVQSCRQDENELVPDRNSLVKKKDQQKLYLKTANDTLKTTSNLSFDADGNEIKDPPPKDKDQWKQKL